MCADPLLASGEAHMLLRCRLYVDPLDGGVRTGGDFVAHRFDMRCHFRDLGDDGHVGILDFESLCRKPFHRFPQKAPAVDLPVRRIVIGKQCADVRFSCRAEQCVDKGMEENVAIGMRFESPVAGNRHTSDPQWLAGTEPVRVITMADSHYNASFATFSRRERIHSARAMSSG